MSYLKFLQESWSLNDTSGSQNADELNEDNDLELFRLCNQPEYGKMIACDNEDCDIVWFHYDRKLLIEMR